MPEYKLVIVSVVYHGKRLWCMANAKLVGNSYQVDVSVINKLATLAGLTMRGQTITVG